MVAHLQQSACIVPSTLHARVEGKVARRVEDSSIVVLHIQRAVPHKAINSFSHTLDPRHLQDSLTLARPLREASSKRQGAKLCSDSSDLLIVCGLPILHVLTHSFSHTAPYPKSKVT